MSGTCSCTLNAVPLVRLKRDTDHIVKLKSSGKPGVFSAVDLGELASGGTESCKLKGGGGTQSLFESMMNGALMGLYPPAPEVDTSELEDMQEEQSNLERSFTECKFKMADCKIDQTKNLLEQQISLSKALQKLIDIAQDASIAKNMSLTFFAIGFVVLIFIYIMAIPTYKPPKSDF